MKYNLHGSEFFLITAECAWGNVSAHPHFFPFYHPQGVLNKYLETNSDLAHCGGITVIWEIRKWNQASWFCSFLFPFLLHSRVERSTQTHMRCSGFAQRQQETCYYKVFLLWQYYHVNPHMGFFFCSPSKFSDTIRYSLLRHMPVQKIWRIFWQLWNCQCLKDILIHLGFAWFWFL